MAECSIRNIRLHVEVPILLLFFGYMFANSVTTNLIIYRTCYVTLGYNESDCALLGTNYTDDATAELEKKVQPHATILFITLSVIEAIFPPVLCFFLGPWSDLYGRKPLLLSTIGGCVLAFLIILIVSAIPFASPWFILLFLIPSCLSGGIPALFTAMLCYITDVTSEEYRGVRMGMLEAVVALGTILGASSSSFVLNACGYVTVYGICVACAVLAWLYTFIFIPESVQNVKKEGKFRSLFHFSLVKTTIKTTFKQRENYERALLLTIISMMIIAVFTNYGDIGVIFLYLRRKFHWTLEKYTLYSSINNATGIAGALIGVFLLHKVLHIREAIVILLGFISTFCCALFQGLGTRNWHIYVAGTIKCLSGAISPMARCLLSKMVSVEDAGKVFSVLTALETIGALFGTTIYTYIYNSTLVKHPAAFNFVSSGTYIFEIGLVIAVLMMQRYHKRIAYRNLDNESQDLIT